jgi:hypothetical protein
VNEDKDARAPEVFNVIQQIKENFKISAEATYKYGKEYRNEFRYLKFREALTSVKRGKAFFIDMFVF